MKFSLVVAIIPIVTLGAGKDINCYGHLNCRDRGKDLEQLTTNQGLSNNVLKLRHNNWYRKYQHIACHRNLCAYFTEGAGGGTAIEAARRIRDLLDAGCKGCGQVNVWKDKDISHGALIVDWVKDEEA